MGRIPSNTELDALLSQAEWLRRLAMCLIHNRPDADDLVQETWLAAMRSPPEPGRPARPWLAQVLRNMVRMDSRGAARRRAREAASDAGEPPVGTDGVLERLELQRIIVVMVKELDEPLRTTLLLRYFEGREPSEIARAQGIPAGTVRWRISEGLLRLRERLDEAHGGRPDAWRALLLPLCQPMSATPAPAKRPRLLHPRAKVALVGAGAVAAGALGVALWKGRSAAPPVAAEVAGQTAPLSARAQTPTVEKETMRKNAGTKAAALFGVVLPALVAGAESAKPLPREEAIAFCVEQREWIAQKCLDDYADLMVERTPPENRATAREEWKKKLIDGGTGPLQPRQEKCAAELDKKAQLASISNYVARDAIRACQKDSDCKTAIACAKKVMFGQNAKR